MKNLKMSFTVRAGLDRVWQALVDPKMIDGWGGGPAKMRPKAGAEFSLWGGDIHGRVTAVEMHKKLEQDWYAGDWPKPSHVIFELKPIEPKVVRIFLTHTDIPDDEVSKIKDGWKKYYFGPIKELLERTVWNRTHNA